MLPRVAWRGKGVLGNIEHPTSNAEHRRDRMEGSLNRNGDNEEEDGGWRMEKPG
jgi:hypothetical protein